MIPGEIIPAAGTLTLNAGRESIALMVANTGDRPIQVGSHYHFFEANRELRFDRRAAYGRHLAIGAGLAVRLRDPRRSIFVIGHFSVARRMTHIVDRGPPGTLVLKWPSDSRPIDLDRLPPGFAPLDEAGFRSELAARFPWLTPQDFAELRDIAAAARPALVATAAASHHR